MLQGVQVSLDEGISRLIQRIYCAGNDASAWDAVAEEVLQRTGGHAGLAAIVDLQNREFNSTRFYGSMDSSFATGIEEYASTHKDDPSLKWAGKHPQARFCDSRKALPRDDYLSNEYIRWNKARFGSTDWCVGFTELEDALSFSFSVHFPADQGPGSPSHLKLFRLLFDHMECAVRLDRRPFDSESERSLILLDPGGSIRQMSRGAEALFRKPGALGVDEKHLVAGSPAAQHTLDRAISASLSMTLTGTRPHAIQIPCPHGRAWIVVLKPILSSYGPFGQIRSELLLEVHAGLPRVGSIELMQSLYDLSLREMQLVRLLVDGHSVESAAEVMGISGNTVRTHLRAIFSKTETTRQSELIHLCAGLSQG